MVSSTASTALSAVLFSMPNLSRIASMSSALFTNVPPMTSRPALDLLGERSVTPHRRQRPERTFSLVSQGISGGRRQPGRSVCLVIGDLVGLFQGETDVVETFEQPPAGVVVDVEARLDRAGAHLSAYQIDGDVGARFALHDVVQLVD